MLTNSSEKEIRQILHSIPIEVIFAGFRGNTLALAQAGWDLSMRQVMSPFGEYEMQLAMQWGDRASAVYALSHPVRLRASEVIGRSRQSNHYEWSQFLAQQVFQIGHVSNGIRFQVIPVRAMSVGAFASEWEGIDARPQERNGEVDIKDFKFFKVAKQSVKDLIVSPDQVPEMLDIILKLQAKGQKEIRAREKSRENFRQYNSGEMFETKPAHEVQAQIITLAG